MENIAHMVDEVCKKVGTRWLPIGAKIDKGEEIPKEECNPSQEDYQIYEETTLNSVEEETKRYNQNSDSCINHSILQLLEIPSIPYNEIDLDKGESTIEDPILEEHKALQNEFEKVGNPILND